MVFFFFLMSLIICKFFYGVCISDGICFGGIYIYEVVYFWQLFVVWVVEVKN